MSDAAITIRLAGPADRPALERLAGRDSAPLPGGELLVAVIDGEVRAALALHRGPAVADPFHPTAELVELLRLRAGQLRGRQARAGSGPRLRAVGLRARPA